MLNTQNIIDKLKNQGIEADTSQIKLITELVDLNIKKKGFLETYLTKNIKKSGIYIWGDVGRGKTLVSKTYLQSLEKPNTRTFSAFFAPNTSSRVFSHSNVLWSGTISITGRLLSASSPAIFKVSVLFPLPLFPSNWLCRA